MIAPILPQRVADYDADVVKFPVLVQPKLDGFRCVARYEDGQWVLRSKTGHALRLPHLSAALADQPIGGPLDGELYLHGASFQQIQSMVPRADRALQFHVFDVITRAPTAARLACLPLLCGPLIKPVLHQTALSHGDVDRLLAATLAAGYEGLILRDPTASYEPGKCTWGLTRLKPSADAEFVVAGHRAATGRNAHLRVLTCDNDLNDDTFDVLCQEVLLDPDAVIGQTLTVRFNGRTSGGLPRHASFLRFRPVYDLGASA